MDNNLNLLTELNDIKRQNIDWEIKLENNTNNCNNSQHKSQRVDDLPQNRLQIIISNDKTIHFNDNNNRINSGLMANNSELMAENNLIINSNNHLISSTNTTNDGIKNVEQYVERRKINGITWYYCKWSGCDYGSNKSNHLVRHVRTHTGEKPYSCDWPNCGKKFTDSWKRKDHLLSHSRKLMTTNQTIGPIGSSDSAKNNFNNINNINNFNSFNNTISNINNNSFKLFMEMFDNCNDNSVNEMNSNVCKAIDYNIDESHKLDEESNDANRDEFLLNSDLNMLIPEVIVSEIDVNSSDNILGNDNKTSTESGPQDIPITSVEQYIERTLKNDKVWYRCKWNECTYGSTKSHHLVRHIRSHTNERPYLCEWPECGKRFTDSYKLKEHQLTHYRKLITTVGNNNKTSMNLIFDLNNKSDKKLAIENSLEINNQLLNRINGMNDVNNGLQGFNNSNNLVNRMTFNVSEQQLIPLNQQKVVMSIKNVEEFVDRRKVDGITKYFCKWPTCTYGSNKSNHLVRHVRTHTNDRPFICDFVGCGKKFTDSWKLRDHKICHNKNKFPNSTITNISLDNGINSIEDQQNAVQIINRELVENVSLVPGLPFISGFDDKLNVKSSTTSDFVMSIKNVEQYVERRKVNGITFYYCKWTDCNYGSNKSNHLVRHVRTHTGERPYGCDYPECGKKFTDSWKLKDHKSIHAKRSLETSLLNSKRLSLVNSLQTNLIETQTNDNCDEQLLTAANVEDDKCSLMEDHEMDLLIPQVIIDEPNESLMDFNKPEAIVYNPTVDDPNQGILSLKNVEQYVEKMTKNDSNWYKCKWNGCDFGCVKSSYIVQHVYKHTGEKPYKCNWSDCNAKYNKKQNLMVHKMSHIGQTPFKCQYPNCYYIGVSSEALLTHFNRHTGELPFKCGWNQCDAQFAAGVELMRHLKTHTGHRLHKCHFPNCSYVSKYRNKLTIHIRRHNGDRPFKCMVDNCGKCFIVRDKLRRHQLSVHKMQTK